MNNALPDESTTGSRNEKVAVRRSEGMLVQLLALNEEMITQLRFERLEVAGTTGFITGMIEDHENAVARLRDQLRSHEADSERNSSRQAAQLNGRLSH
jgi:hypothetical protein